MGNVSSVAEDGTSALQYESILLQHLEESLFDDNILALIGPTVVAEGEEEEGEAGEETKEKGV